MNLQKDTTEAALLGLLDMPEREQYTILANYDLIRKNKIVCLYGDESNNESLADLADRLWKLAVTKALRELVLSIAYVTTKIKASFVYLPEDRHQFWIYDASPIHRIVAALIALKRSGVEI